MDVVPERIVSLVPSLTELIVWLGHRRSLVGRTRFCTEPEESLRTVPIIGGTKNPQLDRIHGLDPDLIVANREENRREDVEALRNSGLEVLLTDPTTVEGALSMIAELGRRLGTGARAATLIQETRRALAEASPLGLPTAVLLWKNPWMALGSESYGHDLLSRCGATNVYGDRPRYPETTLEELSHRAPGVILLTDEPFPFAESDAAELASIAPTHVIDGKILWWYGPRMPQAIRRLTGILREAAA